jgi:hypothetical protein
MSHGPGTPAPASAQAFEPLTVIACRLAIGSQRRRSSAGSIPSADWNGQPDWFAG